MSVKYVPVQWTPNKWAYDAVVVALVVVYVALFLHVGDAWSEQSRPVDGWIARARAFGTCAFFMLTAILCIGPAAKLDARFLPLLYNRRHFGVITFVVALIHFDAVFSWYFAFTPFGRPEAVLFANASYGSALGFPFEALGVVALISLAALAATSHDFWLSFLTPRVWKSLHFLVYLAYAAVVGHVMLGAVQSQENPTFAALVAICAALVAGLHFAAWRAERRDAAATAVEGGTWIEAARVDEVREGFAKVVRLPSGERVAIWRSEGALSAISNHCAHQNGPLGEGRIVDGCVTCPWHGFQYRVEDGRSPAPFTEKVPTYNLRLQGSHVFVDPVANPPGTWVRPIPIREAAA